MSWIAKNCISAYMQKKKKKVKIYQDSPLNYITHMPQSRGIYFLTAFEMSQPSLLILPQEITAAIEQLLAIPNPKRPTGSTHRFLKPLTYSPNRIHFRLVVHQLGPISSFVWCP